MKKKKNIKEYNGFVIVERCHNKNNHNITDETNFTFVYITKNYMF